MSNGIIRIGVHAQSVASAIDAILEATAGEPVAFAISFATEGKAGLYLANCETGDVVTLFESALRQIREKAKGGNREH